MTEIAQRLRGEIQRRGDISFADFMRASLYDPEQGYYSQRRPIGKLGDFFTSVSVGSLFGQLLAFQIARWIEQMPSGALFQCVEAGAHDGHLALDILNALQESEPTIFAALEYWIIEPSPGRREMQEDKLNQFRNVRWFSSMAEIRGLVHGVIFSNELLDAMPVHIFRWDKSRREWNEMGVNVLNEEFVFVELPAPTTVEPKLPEELLHVLPNHYTVELSPGALQWWADASCALARGRLMTIDYGETFEEALSTGRTSGSLRAYSRHRMNPEVLKEPGKQDITANVNFTELELVGQRSGLETELFSTQSQFLMRTAHNVWTRNGPFSRQQVRQFQTLTHPEHLGRLFRVFIQARS